MLLLHRLFHADGVHHQRQVGQDFRSRRSLRLPLCGIVTNLAAFAALGLATASPGVESALGEGETLSEFVEASVRANVERRRIRAEFIARGLRSRDEARRTGQYVDVDVAVAGLQRKLDAARVRLSKSRK